MSVKSRPLAPQCVVDIRYVRCATRFWILFFSLGSLTFVQSSSARRSVFGGNAEEGMLVFDVDSFLTGSEVDIVAAVVGVQISVVKDMAVGESFRKSHRAGRPWGGNSYHKQLLKRLWMKLTTPVQPSRLRRSRSVAWEWGLASIYLFSVSPWTVLRPMHCYLHSLTSHAPTETPQQQACRLCLD